MKNLWSEDEDVDDGTEADGAWNVYDDTDAESLWFVYLFYLFILEWN